MSRERSILSALRDDERQIRPADPSVRRDPPVQNLALANVQKMLNLAEAERNAKPWWARGRSPEKRVAALLLGGRIGRVMLTAAAGPTLEVRNPGAEYNTEVTLTMPGTGDDGLPVAAQWRTSSVGSGRSTDFVYGTLSTSELGNREITLTSAHNPYPAAVFVGSLPLGSIVETTMSDDPGSPTHCTPEPRVQMVIPSITPHGDPFHRIT